MIKASAVVLVKMAERYQMKLIFFLWILFSEMFVSQNLQATPNRFENVRYEDALQVTRCDVFCFYSGNSDKCHKACMKEKFTKRGVCPKTFDNAFARACIKVCANDSECPSTEKCCINSCDYEACVPADDLQNDEYLPPIPVNATVEVVHIPSREIHLKWEIPEIPNSGKHNQIILYLVEEQHHIGHYYNHLLLGPWNPIATPTDKTSVTLRNVLKPARFYHFRVASVNVNGTKGFSAPSKYFNLAVGKDPKLGKPRGLRLVNVTEVNGTFWGTLKWRRPKTSEIPIQYYSISYSKRLPGVRSGTLSDSIYKRRHSVPKSRSSYQLKGLEINEVYFIQVQALAGYRNTTVRSGKASISCNTTLIGNNLQSGTSKEICRKERYPHLHQRHQHRTS